MSNFLRAVAAPASCFLKQVACLGLLLLPLLAAYGQTEGPSTETTSASAVRYTEIARKVKQFADHTVTIIKVQPPTLPAAPAPKPAPEPTEAERAMIARRATKTFETLTVTATVFIGTKRTVTELTWTIDEKKYRAFSNADFRLLTQLVDIETDTSVFSWFPFVSAVEGEPDTTNAAALNQLAASGSKVDYVMEGDEQAKKANATTFDALDYLHAHYQVNQAELMTAWLKREAEAEENERKRAETPPPSPVIRYWPTPAKKL